MSVEGGFFFQNQRDFTFIREMKAPPEGSFDTPHINEFTKGQ